MKKITLFAILLTVLILALGIFFLHWLLTDPKTPRFIPAKGHVTVGKYDRMSYNFLDPSPFEGGKMWVTVISKNMEYHIYLFDLETQAILGELTNASPVSLNHDQTRLLFAHHVRANVVRKTITACWTWLTTPKGRSFHLGDDLENFWVVDLKQNSATQVGHVFQGARSGSSFEPSPDFRFGCIKPTGSFNDPELFICNLENGNFRRDTVAGDPVAWWDNRRILMKATNDDFVLYDVETRKTSPLLPLQQLKAFYANSGLTNDPAKSHPFLMRNGEQNEFYLCDGNKRWSAMESFLIKLEHPDGKLKLLDPHFKFEWSDHFDATGNYYLYSGRKSGETNSAVYLRDLQTRQTRELVPPDPNHTNTFSIPRFYRDEVIYTRSNALWRINLDGSHNRRFFPPPDASP